MKIIDGELYPEKSDPKIKRFNNKNKKNNITPISLNKTDGSSLYNEYAIKHDAQRQFMNSKIIDAIIDQIRGKTSNDEYQNFLDSPKNFVISIPVQKIYDYFDINDYIYNVHNRDPDKFKLAPRTASDIYDYIYKNFKDIKKLCKKQDIYIKAKKQYKYYRESTLVCLDESQDLLIECRIDKMPMSQKINKIKTLDFIQILLAVITAIPIIMIIAVFIRICIYLL